MSLELNLRTIIEGDYFSVILLVV